MRGNYIRINIPKGNLYCLSVYILLLTGQTIVFNYQLGVLIKTIFTVYLYFDQYLYKFKWSYVAVLQESG